MFRKALLVFAMVALLTPASVSAGVFDLSITSNPGLGTEQTWSQSFKSISDVIDNLDTAEIKDKLSLYTDTSAANGLINFRGVPINLSIGLTPILLYSISLQLALLRLSQEQTGMIVLI